MMMDDLAKGALRYFLQNLLIALTVWLLFSMSGAGGTLFLAMIFVSIWGLAAGYWACYVWMRRVIERKDGTDG